MGTVDHVTHADDAPAVRDQTRQLIFFILLTFALSWGWWVIWTAFKMPAPLFVVGTAGPTFAAFIVLGITSGKAGVLRLLASYVQWRAGLRWYLLTMIGLPVMLFLSYMVVPGALAGFVAPDWSLLPTYGRTLFFTLFIPPSGPLLEEGGWRGFALSPLQRLLGPLNGTLVLGVLWGLWHVPFFIGPLALTGPDVTLLSASITFGEYMVGIVGFTVLTTWVFNNTGGSVLMAILLHLGFDVGWTFAPCFPTVANNITPISLTLGMGIVFGLVATAIIIATRGRLGYQDEGDRLTTTGSTGSIV